MLRSSWWLVTLLSLAATVPASGEPCVGVSLKGGWHARGWFPHQNYREYAFDVGPRWTLGPAVDVRLTQRFAVEAAALYRGLRADQGGGYSSGGFRRDIRGRWWEVPVVARVRVLGRLLGLQPFALGGVSVHRRTLVREHWWTAFTSTGSTRPEYSVASTADWSAGVTFGGGVERRLGRARAVADVRFTHWGKREFIDFGGGRIESPTQILLLFGIGF